MKHNILNELCRKEYEAGCYSVSINGVYIYSYIRSWLRTLFLINEGIEEIDYKQKARKGALFISSFKSFFQLLGLFLSKKKYSNLIYSFYRTDKVGDVYVDKFTDPIIDFSEINDDYIIIEHSVQGMHKVPRIHRDHLLYSDFINVYGLIKTRITRKRFIKKNKVALNDLFSRVESVFEGMHFDRNLMIDRIIVFLCAVRFYERIMKKISTKRLFAPSRRNFLPVLYAAKSIGVECFELQHGITYGETITYSGYQDPMFTPDFFLSFGDMNPKTVYGIDENRIINIGWAFQKYVETVQYGVDLSHHDVLVISDPEITDKLLFVIEQLAVSFPDYSFYFRPHPMEFLNAHHLNLIQKHKNIILQDNKVNIAVVLSKFINVLGENSTVLYEALSYGKKVAKLAFEGFMPLYLVDSDRDCFWEVKDKESFSCFINGGKEDKKSKMIYSVYDEKVINHILER